jgi:hypothetical protein
MNKPIISPLLQELLYRPDLEAIPFAKNWNQKLDCEVFTTLRPLQPKKYKPGKHYVITLNGERIGVAVCLDVKVLKLGDLNEWQARLDTGMSREEAVNLLHSFYPVANYDFMLNWVLLKNIR